MKLTTRILVLLFIVMVAGLLSSNIILKKQYDAFDKSDSYWTYNKILEQPFRHLNITGGNGTNIYYEQSSKPSVRLLQEWVQYHNGRIAARVQNDTLYINFDYVPATPFDRYYLENAAPVRIFSPELLSVTGNDTHIEMQRLKQKSISVHITGKSKFELESMYPELDAIDIYQSDSSAVVFEMSPDYRKPAQSKEQEGKIAFHNSKGELVEDKGDPLKRFDETMSFKSVTANITGHSILDIGHAQIGSLHAAISDSSAIVLSGNALQLLKQK